MSAYITQGEVEKLAYRQAELISKFSDYKTIRAYPIPRGGVPAAYAIQHHIPGRIVLVDKPDNADIYIDDLVDSGKTKLRFSDKPFFALIDKRADVDYSNRWIVWPWEGSSDGSFENNIVRLLQYIGEDPARTGLLETPTRVAKAWKEWTSGYGVKPEDVLKCFEDGAQGVDEMVVLKDFPIYSHCEHHLAAIFGTITIAYIPSGKIVGLSKLGRLANIFAKRLQVQERLTNQVADALHKALNPVGVGVVVKARHLCMESRGLHQQGHITITSAVRGALKDKPEARAEFMEFVR